MEKPVPIKRIDLLVHPFHYPGSFFKIPYTKKEAKDLFKIWKKQIDKAAADPNRLLLFFPTVHYRGWQKKLIGQQEAYAKKKLGKRFGFFHKEGKKGKPFYNSTGIGSATFETFLLENGFRANPKKVKTRGFGEYTNSCVLKFLTELNMQIGIKDPIPYRNRQSTVLARKSVGADFKPWTLKDLMKTAAGRAILKKAGEKYAWRRLENANRLLEKLGLDRQPYKPRPHLMKRKP